MKSAALSPTTGVCANTGTPIENIQMKARIKRSDGLSGRDANLMSLRAAEGYVGMEKYSSIGMSIRHSVPEKVTYCFHRPIKKMVSRDSDDCGSP